MAGRRRRVRKGRRLVLRVMMLGVLAAGGSAGVLSGKGNVHPASSPAETAAAAQPLTVAQPTHLDATYRAPVDTVPEIGRLRSARLGLDAAIVQVGWDGDTMAVPNNVATAGWFSSSAGLRDRAGTSLIAGHVADEADRPGAFAVLAQARVGDIVEWTGTAGTVRFRVTSLANYPRSQGLPPTMFGVEGRHTLLLVTCANRKHSGSGFHYADNLVVSAVEV